VLFSTCDTVVMDTPAAAATSTIRATCYPSRLVRRPQEHPLARREPI
jgi:hypothetical protein